ncbi:hypothetical protein BRI6_1056 [plant metagenome]|uniref:Uncharacterized protein n=2 Tax=root TaxID=1 RepID=A0A1C3JX17_9BURK|nr:hypothetical protein ODI_03773 [Orrella dioscoreae]SOE47746.1 hypothetical protein ODI_R1023 [Orrella dioscoreae]
MPVTGEHPWQIEKSGAPRQQERDVQRFEPSHGAPRLSGRMASSPPQAGASPSFIIVRSL